MKYQYKILITYLMIAIVVLLLMLPVYNVSLKIVKDSTIISVDKNLENGVSILDNEIKNLHRVASAISVHPSLQKISNIHGEMNTSDYYKLRHSQDFIAQTMNYFNYTEGIALVLSNDFVITESRAFTSMKEYYDVFFYDLALTREEWLENIYSQSGGMLPEKNIYTFDHGEKEMLCYIVSLPLGSTNNKTDF